MSRSPDSPDGPPFDAADRAIAAALRRASPPTGLKERILAAQAEEPGAAKIVTGPWFTRPALWLAAAAMFVAAFAVFALMGRGQSFDSFRDRVTAVDTRKAVAGGLPWALETRDVAEIGQFLQRASLPGDPVAFQPPAAYGALGCRIHTWRGIQYSVVCFYDTKGKGVHLYMAKSAVFEREPASTPQFASVSGLPTASWSRDGVSYVLVGSEGMDLHQIVPPARG